MFRSLQIRYKFLFSYTLLFFLTSLVLSIAIYAFVRKTIEAGIERELNQTTGMILNMVKTSASVSIRNHLRAVAEKNRDIVSYYYRQSHEGTLPEDEAKKRAAAMMLSQTIGTSGYIYCLDSNATVVVHPEEELLQSDVSSHAFVREQVKARQGYIEYEWKNPGETDLRPKALYMVYFEPWDWIISASSYRNEFRQLVNVDDFKKSILSLKFGKTGYSFVLDKDGRAVIHPKLQGVNVLENQSFPTEYPRDMLERKKGKSTYPWKNPGETEARQKMVIFNYLPEYQWVVASSSYPEEFYGPLITIRNTIFGAFGAALLLVLPMTFTISSTITGPLKRLMAQFDRAGTGDFSARMAVDSQDEVGKLAKYFNRFMAQLETYNRNLEEQMAVRRRAEEAWMVTQERFRSAMEAAPDPIVTYDMDGRVTYFNSEFTRVFGWTFDECNGKKLDHFVPEENWDETTLMIERILSGKSNRNIETRRITKDGKVLTVSISSSTYRDTKGNLAGSVIILRDITDSKYLEKMVMDISDMERQKIGQDLHDDLCPHLIGIEGLATVLKLNLMEGERDGSDPDVTLADRITGLMEEAIAKTRILARGLCPVHLVSHGLHSALEETAVHVREAWGIDCRFAGDETIVIEDNTMATHLYYICKEAVNNAVRHSGARSITIALKTRGTSIHLSVRDDGRGIGDRSGGKGIGLRIMHHRAKMINAMLEIKTRERMGTTIELFLKTPGETDTGENRHA